MEGKDKPQVGGILMHADGTPEPDFSGYASKYGIKCSDGRTILKDAFKHQDTMQIPLVWQHTHSEPENVLGHVILEHRDDGPYCYGYFNDTERGKSAKTLVEHKDISSLSIYANQLVEKAKQVSHGIIREVSLVLAGANPGAMIDNISLAHGDEIVTLEDEAVIYSGVELVHADSDGDSGDGPTVQEVYDGMTDDQKSVVHYMVGQALEEAGSAGGEGSGSAEHSGLPKKDAPNPDREEGRRMSRNVFEQQKSGEGAGEMKHTLTQDAMRGIAKAAVRHGSLKEAVEEYALQHGIDNIDILFPDARTVTDTPEFDARRVEWVRGVLGGTKHVPFSRIKSVTADITHDEARARGYIKGNFKKEEWFGLVKRVTTPSTVYKKQQLERDDIIDITDFDVVVWLKSEMRLMLDEEIARAILIGDGREVDDEDKIKDPAGSNEGAGIRSILNDDDLYAATINVNIDDANSTPQEIVEAVMLNMRFYKGSGNPTLYTTLPMLTKMLLAKDGMGRRLWRTASELASEMGVAGIVTVEVMESEPDLIGIIVNLRDYTVGTDRGGDVTMFDDFDIDYNQYKYLIETRLSGALTKIRSALVLKKVDSGAAKVVPAAPTQDDDDYEVHVVNTTGVTYKVAAVEGAVTYNSAAVTEGQTVTASYPLVLPAGASVMIEATPSSGSYFFENNVEDEWTFTRPAA
jgi:hypothetical protein